LRKASSALQHIPFRRGNDPGNDIQRERALLTGEIKSDTTVQEGAGHRIGACADIGKGEFTKGLRHLLIRAPGLLSGGEHLVVGSGAAGGHGVILE
jgi:hypothetical protein